MQVPRYDRSQVQVGIVHFGVGGFHRAHQAMYLDRLMSRARRSTSASAGSGVLPVGRPDARRAARAGRPVHAASSRHADGPLSTRVIGSIVRYLYAPDDPAAVVDVLADPGTRIVSLTVTEGGYCLDPRTGEFDAGHPAVRADLEPGAARRGTAFGLIVEALARRRAAAASRRSR